MVAFYVGGCGIASEREATVGVNVSNALNLSKTAMLRSLMVTETPENSRHA